MTDTRMSGIARSSVPLRAVLLAGAAGLLPIAGYAQSPVASSFATKDGRASTVILACPTTNSTYFAEFCGVAGYPMHVTVDSGAISATDSSMTTPGTASTQVVGVQGGGSGSLPVGISATALPLPTGASTSSLQSQLDPNDAGSWVHVLNFPTTQPVSGAVGVSSLPALPAGSNAIGSVSVSNLPSNQAVSVASLPLPAGAATAALQPAINADGGALVHITNLGTSSGTVASTVSVSNFPATQPVSGSVGVSSLPALPAGSNAIGSVSVSNLPATQPVSGSVGVSSLPALPAGSNAIGSVSVSNLPATQPVSGSVSVSNLPATQAVSAASLPLPSGAATAALQPALNSDGGALAHVSNFPATQAVSGTVGVSSLPALPAGSNAIGAVTVSNLPSTQAVSAASLPLPSGAATAALQPALNSDGGALAHVSNFPATQAVSGTVTVSSLPALPAGSNAIGAVSVSNLPSTQAVSAASLPLPTGAATASGVAAVVTALGSPLQAGGTVTVSSLPALPAGSNAIGSVSVSNLPSTQAVSAAALPLPTGAATASGVAAVVTALGSPLQAGGTVTVSSLPALPAGSNAIGSVSVSNLPSTQAVSAASLPLPAGAATASGVAAVVTALGSPLQAGGTVTVSSLPALPAGSNAIGSVSVSALPQSARSGAWTDASVTATGTAAVPSGLAAVSSRIGLHLWNVGSSTVCMNYSSTAAISGSGCAAGSVPIPAGSAYLEDQPGNVSPEAISLICTGTSCPLTIKVR